MLLQKLINSQLYTEYQSNKRLQWMAVLIVTILTLSLVKQLSEILSEQRSETSRQVNLLTRLTQTSTSVIDPEVVRKSDDAYANLLSSLPQASSPSTAEAQALVEVEQKIGLLLTRKRLNLLGSEAIGNNGLGIWSVRIEITGKLKEQDLIEVLGLFDAKVQHRRIASFQYSPAASNTINLVIDLMYMRASND
jgi:hypothetical protein